MPITQMICLADFYNAAPIVRTESDVREALWEIRHYVVELVSSVRPEIQEIDLRLYGGWVNKHNRTRTRHADWVTKNLGLIRGRAKGIIVRPQLALALAISPKIEIIGTFRRVASNTYEQKIVDTMLTADAAHIARWKTHEVMIWSE